MIIKISMIRQQRGESIFWSGFEDDRAVLQHLTAAAVAVVMYCSGKNAAAMTVPMAVSLLHTYCHEGNIQLRGY